MYIGIYRRSPVVRFVGGSYIKCMWYFSCSSSLSVPYAYGGSDSVLDRFYLFSWFADDLIYIYRIYENQNIKIIQKNNSQLVNPECKFDRLLVCNSAVHVLTHRPAQRVASCAFVLSPRTIDVLTATFLQPLLTTDIYIS